MKKYQCSPTLSLGPRVPLPLSLSTATNFFHIVWQNFSFRPVDGFQKSLFLNPLLLSSPRTYKHKHTHMHTLTLTHIFLHTYRWVHTQTDTYTHTSMHTLTHARTHAHTLSQSCNVYTSLALNSSILLQLLPVFSDFLFKSIGSESFEGEKKEMLIQKVVFEYFKFSILISSWSLISDTRGQSIFILV